MTLCTWRMEQRERRPLREQVRDTAEVCLEVEKATLVDAQRKLKDCHLRKLVAFHGVESFFVFGLLVGQKLERVGR